MLRTCDRYDYISQGIIYDIWGAAVHPSEDADKIRVPLLAINSEAFTYWPSNFELVESLVREAQDGPDPCPAWSMTIRGTVHITQSDFSILYPILCSLFLKEVANPRRALDLNINATLEFLGHVLPSSMSQVSRAYRNENLLASDISPLDRIPSAQLRRPDTEHIALTLGKGKRRQQSSRMSPKLFQKLNRVRSDAKGKEPEPGDEIWLHIKPTAESIERHFKAVESRQDAQQEKSANTTLKPQVDTSEADSVPSPPAGELTSPTSTVVNPDPSDHVHSPPQPQNQNQDP
jgi:platelet-activating factor acetylhydrolase